MLRLSLDLQRNVTVGLKTLYSIFQYFPVLIIKIPFESPALETRRSRESRGSREIRKRQNHHKTLSAEETLVLSYICLRKTL